MLRTVEARIVRSSLVLALAAGAGGGLVAQQSVVNVNVAVLDGAGRPVPGLSSDAFEIAVDGRPGKIVSAEFATSTEGRVFMLAIDTASFGAAESIGVAATAQGFVDRLQPSDKVGVFTYPGSGPHADPSVDRVDVRHALETLVGEKDSTNGDLASRTAAGLDGVGAALATIPGRKIVVLICGVPGAPAAPPEDASEPLERIGRGAAASNAVVYTLLLGSGFLESDDPAQARPLEGRSRAGARRQRRGALVGAGVGSHGRNRDEGHRVQSLARVRSDPDGDVRVLSSSRRSRAGGARRRASRDQFEDQSGRGRRAWTGLGGCRERRRPASGVRPGAACAAPCGASNSGHLARDDRDRAPGGSDRRGSERVRPRRVPTRCGIV